MTENCSIFNILISNRSNLSNRLSTSVGAIYLRKYIKSDSKAEALKMIQIIHQEFRKTLQRTSWMDEHSIMAAINKVNAMEFDIGYPDELFDDKKLEEYYNELELQPNDYLNNLVRVNRFLRNKKKHRFHKTVNRTDWIQHAKMATKVNAFYSVPQNTIRKSILYF